MDATPHYLVVAADPDDDEYLTYSVECGGVTEGCRRFESCAPNAAEREVLNLSGDNQPVAHGQRHIQVDGEWCAETEQCNVVNHPGLPDAVADQFPVGRHLIEWDFGDGTELLIVAAAPV